MTRTLLITPHAATIVVVVLADDRRISDTTFHAWTSVLQLIARFRVEHPHGSVRVTADQY